MKDLSDVIAVQEIKYDITQVNRFLDRGWILLETYRGCYVLGYQAISRTESK